LINRGIFNVRILYSEHKYCTIRNITNIMIAEDRKAFIISQIESGGTVDISELTTLLNVSEMTIRRDLNALEREGVLRRVHGGAVNARGRSYEPPLPLRNAHQSEAKQSLGELAAALIEEGDCIALDVGSTTMEIARNLIGRQNLTVITPSLYIASLLVNQVGIRVIVPGGILRPGEASMIGDLAQRAFETLFVDKLFLGIGGIDAQAGFTEYNWDDTLTKRAMIRCAKQVIVVADGSKFGRVAFALVAKYAEVHKLVTDQPPPEDIRLKLDASGVSLDVVPPMAE
jgi:DeoR family transcriptional regulator, fructose operon transcriptional repressor